MKKKTWLILIGVLVILAATALLLNNMGLINIGKSNIDNSNTTGSVVSDTLISDAILSRNADLYLTGECQAEGHIVLKTEETDRLAKIYAIVSYGEFGFENGIFTKISGSGAIPTVITFEKDQNGSYEMKDYKEPIDGTEYESSLKNMFPSDLMKNVLSVGDYYPDLAKKQEDYAKKYLQSIGRDAVVQEEYVEKTLPQMNTEVSNELLKLYCEYPYWIGSEERIENNVRYVYKTDWQDAGNGDGTVTFTKSIYNGDTVEKTVIQIKDGKMQYIEGTPRS